MSNFRIKVAEEGAVGYYSTTREVANYNNLNLTPEDVNKLATKYKGDEEPPVIINFMDTIGLGDTSVTYTDEEIQELIKAELMEKTTCD